MYVYGFRFYFTPLTGVLFAFPSRYWFTIGRQLVFSLTPWSGQIHATFHVCCATQELHRASSGFVHGPVTRYGNAFQRFRLPSEVPSRVLQPRDQRPRFGLFRFRSPLLTESHSFSFPLVTEMFHFTRYRVSIPILFRMERFHITGIRLPHSEISGSKPVCGSPKLIAAYHVLHRLLAPRHSLYALNSLIPVLEIS